VTTSEENISVLVRAILEADTDTIDSAVEHASEAEVATALGTTFTLAAARVAPRIETQERRAFYRQVSARPECEGPAWMVEAAFRYAEKNDADALTGVDGDRLTSVMTNTLGLLIAHYLTEDDRAAIHTAALAHAMENLSLVEELAVSRSQASEPG